jgi:hypothetical protein
MEHTNTPIATAAQRQALRRNQQQRMCDQAEALEPPTTYKEAEQAAKTLLVVGKVLDAVHTETHDDEPTNAVWVTMPKPEAEMAALTSWQAVLGRSLETLATARRMARETEI